MSDLTSWLLSHYGQEQLKVDPDFSRIKSALSDNLRKLQTKRIITIAGTNGKGETTLRLSQLLKARSHCVWTSPHISRITERFRDEQGEIALSNLTCLIKECHADLQKRGIRLSYYEFLFYVFCTWVIQKDPELLLLEVGLGGRLDSVNVLDAEMVLLPSISRDHQEFLGNRYDLILQEKLGLLRPQSLLLSFLHLRYLREKTRELCRVVGSEWVDLEEVMPLPPYEFSARNHLLAYAAFQALASARPVDDLRDPKTFADWSFEGEFLEHRGEVIQRDGEYLFFGSHNLDGMRKLIQFLHSGNYTFKRPPFDAVIVAFSRRNEQDLRLLAKMVKDSGLGEVIVTSFAHPKAAPMEQMENLARQEGLRFVQDMESYVQGSNKHHQRILVTGSYYFLGYFKSLLGAGG